MAAISASNTLNFKVSDYDEVVTTQRHTLLLVRSLYGISKLRDHTHQHGNGTVTHANNEYIVSSNGDGNAMLVTAECGRYQTGYAAQASVGVRLPATNVFTPGAKARWGYFNDTDGVYFGQTDEGLYVGYMQNGTYFRVYQQDWNVDPLDGTGESRQTLDLTRGNLFMISFTWYGFNYGQGVFNYKVMLPDLKDPGVQREITVHRLGINGQTSLAVPNLPVGAEVTTTTPGQNVTIYVSGRQFILYGNPHPVTRSVSAQRLSTAVSATWVPLITLRRKNDGVMSKVILTGFEVFAVNAPMVIQVRLDATVTGGSYVAPPNISASETLCEVNITSTAVSGGEALYTAFAHTDSANNFIKGFTEANNLDIILPHQRNITICAMVLQDGSNPSTPIAHSLLRWNEDW